MARMDQLDKVEKEVVNCLHTAGMALSEVAKDKPSQKQVDLLVTQFMNSLQYLTEVSTGQPREGISYASQKVCCRWFGTFRGPKPQSLVTGF